MDFTHACLTLEEHDSCNVAKWAVQLGLSLLTQAILKLLLQIGYRAILHSQAGKRIHTRKAGSITSLIWFCIEVSKMCTLRAIVLQDWHRLAAIGHCFLCLYACHLAMTNCA
eukprot:6031150-Amphidinium_carterae.1